MIETEQTVVIGVGDKDIWSYVRDIRRWADLMPGMRECEVIDDDNSRWTLKVGVGGLVRTVRVLVHVDEWDEPGRVLFSFKLEGDPVQGGGVYSACTQSPFATEVTLRVRVEGSGPMAPMWEAMGRPLLPKLAKGFADMLRDAIEAASPTARPADGPAQGDVTVWARFRRWLRKLLRRRSDPQRC